MKSFMPLLPIALEAVEVGGELIRSRPPGKVTAKGDRDMASELDFAVERAVRAFLEKKTPSIGFLGEEEGPTGSDVEPLWTLDPIDGTANFVHSIPLSGISLGLMHEGRPVLGVIDLPFLGSRYSAVERHGAFVGQRRLRASGATKLRDAIIAVGDYDVGPDAEANNRLQLAITEQLAARALRVRMLGSAAIDLAWVAEGRLDASIALSNTPWDMAAGVILAREAGAQVVDRNGTSYSPESTATIAVAPELLQEVIDVMRQAGAVSAETGQQVGSNRPR
jgi:myo-inositol-1(or 4)-monophosphatase